MKKDRKPQQGKPTQTISRRNALKIGSMFLAATALPRNLQAEESVVATSSSVMPEPRKLTVAQRDGITGKTADLGNGYFLNPILAGDYSDPAVLKDGKDYYMSHSMCGGLTPGILIWHSRDLINWEPVCRALKTSSC